MRYPSINKESRSSLRNALQLLNLFTMDEPELSLSQIADKLQVGISTAHRLTYTLIVEGFLTKDSQSKKFRLGASILGMGNTIITQNQLCRISIPVLENLAINTGESAHIAILKDYQAIYLIRMDSKHPVHLLSHAGKQNPIHCTSSGQVILAFQSETMIEQVIACGLQQYTANTITTADKFKQLLLKIQSQGYSISEEELHEGVSSIAVPVKDISGHVIASISIAGPISRINQDTLPRLVKIVKQAADKVSEQLIFSKR
ncbi:IclR family transcriptional regulator [Schinkia azotoformans]|uniref:Glycerol operon regulatory protein n=1 Tax=Schinkia azotoformans LMG 9581 TaxID=1131731 RepID=K6E280_SCHAZ|nr:IclR family transcriptional regulator [Schinkia azotoformans]EKN67296.1 IclR family protein transcriptional regulator [Schinkia azotoformans LMG 9581]MEC1639454.1 IclR family transcriptional regulator [Schinkia azotoformans]MEC1944292.1 IclR family transcriptional regulator [Schinkia azotoformans]